MQNEGDSCGSPSLLTPLGYQAGDCGYCKAEDSSQRTPASRASYYARSKSLCPRHYQELMDRGWRRLPASRFKPSRDQRQALNRWNHFVLGEAYEKEVAKKYPKTKEDKKRESNTFDLLTHVHESEKAHTKPEIKPEHTFVVTLEPDTLTDEKFALFNNYQRKVHHESDSDISQGGFKRFLCSSPLHRHQEASGRKLGSFHHCYRLDGRLIAMSVLDLLPHAVSGVYFIYHSDFEKWSFGKLSALREAALAMEGGYEYYYMGYYIHGCKKMRYKGDYKPQYVLDYYTFEWNVLDYEMRALMDRTKYASMSRERQRQAEATQTNGGASNPDHTSDHLRPPQEEHPLASPAEEEEEPDLLPLYPTPLAAVAAGLSLPNLGMPGIMSFAELHAQFDLNTMRISLGRQGIHEMQDLVSWHAGSESEPTSIKGIMAEMAAAVGPAVAKGIIVDLGR